MTIIAIRKLEEQEKSASKVDSSENIENETEEDVDADKGEGSHIDSRADTSKKPSMPRGESKQSHTSQVLNPTNNNYCLSPVGYRLSLVVPIFLCLK